MWEVEHLKQTYSRYTTRRAAPSVHPAVDPPSASEDERERGWWWFYPWCYLFSPSCSRPPCSLSMVQIIDNLKQFLIIACSSNLLSLFSSKQEGQCHSSVTVANCPLSLAKINLIILKQIFALNIYHCLSQLCLTLKYIHLRYTEIHLRDNFCFT